MLKVSVVIPAFNEEKNIIPLLESLYIHASRKPDEIVVVDANSSDKTAEYVKAWKNKNSVSNLKLIELDNVSYPGKARNVGVKNSGCDYIAFIDCGIIPHVDWLKIIVAAFEEDSSIEVVWARSRSKADTTWENTFAAVTEYNSSIERSVRSSCIKKASFYLIGMFREDLRAGEDLLYKKAIKHFKIREGFVPVDAWYTGYPESFKAAFEKWALYSEHSVYAGIYKNKLIFSLIEIILFLSILFTGVVIFKSILIGILGAFVILPIRILTAIKRSSKSLKSGKEYFRAVGIIVSTDTGRIVGLVRGLIRRSRGHTL